MLQLHRQENFRRLHKIAQWDHLRLEIPISSKPVQNIFTESLLEEK